MIGRDLRGVLLASATALVFGVAPAASSAAETPAPGWAITSYARPANFSSSDYVDEVDDIAIKATGGTFTLSYAGSSTGSLACDAPAATVQSQLEALSTVGAGNATVTGGSASCSETNTTPYAVTFGGSLTAQTVELSGNGVSLVGTSPTVTISNPPSVAPFDNDAYILVVTNIGGAPSSPGAVIQDTLPADVRATAISVEDVAGGKFTHAGSCVLATSKCIIESVPPLETVDVTIDVAPVARAAPSVTNLATVAGGGAPSVATTNANPNTVNASAPTPFGFGAFNFSVGSEDGTAPAQAGAHPYSLTTAFDVNSFIGVGGYNPVGNPKDIVVDLPLGFLGDPLATTERCPIVDMDSAVASCPVSSRLGYSVVETEVGHLNGTRSEHASTKFSAVYNLVPEHGYPAELGVEEVGKIVILYASVVHTSSGYGLRVAVPGFVRSLGIMFGSLTLFGDPAQQDGGTSPGTAFFTNPADCSAGPLAARIEANSWQEPQDWASAESVAYPDLDDCSLLGFTPTFATAPSTTAEGSTSQADEPSAYTDELRVPQRTGFDESATPELKNVSVIFPEGLSVSASAAEGLEGCEETGPEGIDIPTAQAHPDEAGEGEEVGADGLAHLVAGHCPEASILGSVEVSTPLLPHSLTGHLYLAQPKCGGKGQPPCTEASATNGELYALYIEVAGEGVVVKLPGVVSANPSNGQLTARFTENPQLPFEDLTVHMHGGPRAPLANPQTCGTIAASSDLSAWSGGLGGTPEVTGPSAPFTIDWDGHGGACPASLPFAPGFSAGTVSPSAGGYSPLSVTFARQDREQYLSALQVKTPPGLLGMLSHVTLCGEPQAQQGTCGAESQIGHTTVSAGAGEHPFYLGGRVFLTGPYDGAPFGLSVVVPVIAGPFNLGNVIVRAAISVNPQTAALTVTSGPLPQIIDGVPTRLRTINVTVDRPEFTFNATNCATQQISATLAGAQGASASVSSPYAPSGCANLPFKPSLAASTQAKTSKADGAELIVKVAQKPGEANIAKVQLELPKLLPSRLSTLNKACPEAQFNANPADCPAGSVIGTAKAITPALNVPLTGPAILVSHGGAAFPDVEFILQGQGVTIVLDGKTQIKNGITYSRFETVPDAPISSFETVLPEGPYSILGTDLPTSANYSLCGQSPAMPTIITAQNGAQITQTTKIAVTGCKASKPVTRAQKLAKALKACRKQYGHSKAKRKGCERTARKRYGPKAKGKKSARQSAHGKEAK